jgi:hypothetical protein
MLIKGLSYLNPVQLEVTGLNRSTNVITFVYKHRFEFTMWYNAEKKAIQRNKGLYSVVDLLDPTGPGRPGYTIPNKAATVAYRVASLNLKPSNNQQLGLFP